MDFIGLSDRSYRIGWIVLYRLNRIVLAGLYCIGWIISGSTGFYALAGYWLDGTDGLDGMLVRRGWDGPTLAGARTGALTLDLEGRRAMGSFDWNQLRLCCKGAEYLCQRRKIIQIDCTQIRTNT